MAVARSTDSPVPAAMTVTCEWVLRARNRSAPAGDVTIAASTTSPSNTFHRLSSRSTASNKDVALAALAELLTKSQQLRFDHLKHNASVPRTAGKLFHA